jgi:hypothetical protein
LRPSKASARSTVTIDALSSSLAVFALALVAAVGVSFRGKTVVENTDPDSMMNSAVNTEIQALENLLELLPNEDTTNIMADDGASAIMADDFELPDVPGYTLQRFDSSNFKREYEWAATKPLLASQTGRLLEAVRRVIDGYCARHNIDQVRGDNFYLALRGEWQLIDDVSIAAERLWTSKKTMDSGTGRNPEFCFVFSELLREDPASLARSCAIIARALNLNLIAGRTESVDYPQNGECWRGGGFDEQHRQFFEVGKTYRVPGFLASSLKKSVTQTFLFRAEAAGYPVVQWCIKLNPRADPQGENSHLHRCKHVNLLRVTHVPGEVEYLFAAYSVFTVCDEPGNPYWSTNPTTQNPHRITIEAAIDNSLEAEDLPLAPWS